MNPTRRDFLQAAAGLGVVRAASARQPGPRIAVLAGAGIKGMAADGDAAETAHLNYPYGMAEPRKRDSLYFVDNGSNRVLRFEYRTKKIFVVAGTGAKGFGGDGGPAAKAIMAQPHETHFDSKGNLYIVERDNFVVRRVDAKTGIIQTFAGTPESKGFSGDGGPATKAQFNQPHGIALDPADNLYICDVLNNRVRRVDAKTGVITTFAGTGAPGRAPDDAPLTGAPLEGPRSLEISRAGKIYVALREGNAVFELNAKTGRMKRIGGTGESGYSGDGGPAIAAKFGGPEPRLTGPKGLCVTEDGNTMFVADCENHVVRKIDLRTGIISTVAGTGQKGDGPDGDPLKCLLNRPHAVYTRGGVLYIGDSDNHRIRTLAI